MRRRPIKGVGRKRVTQRQPPNAARAKRLVLRGAIALSEGHDVVIVAQSVSHAQAMASQLRDLAVYMGFPGYAKTRLTNETMERIRFAGVTERDAFRGVAILDHTAPESDDVRVIPASLEKE